MATSAAIAERNQRIIAQLDAGARAVDVAHAFNLSPSRVHAIRRNFAAVDTTAATKRAGTFGEIGTSGLNYSAGYVQEEFLAALKTAPKRYQIFNEMRQNSPVVGAIMLLMELLIRAVEWRIEGEDDDRKEFINGAREDMSDSWNSFISQVLTMIVFGFSFFEIVYKRRLGPEAEVSSQFNDGKVGWRKFAFRSQDSVHSWDFDERGNVQAMNQLAYPYYQAIAIPLNKALLFRTSTEKNSPEGRSLLRPAYVPYYYVKNLQTVEAIGAERDVAGLPMVELPEGADTSENSSDITAAKNLVQRIRVDEQGGIVLPAGWKASLLSAAGSKQFNISDIIARYEKRIAMVVLAQFLLLGMDKVGSFSLSSDQSDLFVGAVNAVLDIISETFNKFAIVPLLKLNGMSLDNPPRLEHGSVGKPNLQALQQFFGGLTAYIKPDVELEQFLRELADAPELSEEEIAKREAQQQQMQQVRDQRPAPTQQDQQQQSPDGTRQVAPSQQPIGKAA